MLIITVIYLFFVQVPHQLLSYWVRNFQNKNNVDCLNLTDLWSTDCLNICDSGCWNYKQTICILSVVLSTLSIYDSSEAEQVTETSCLRSVPQRIQRAA
jgi:hypothetical protein